MVFVAQAFQPGLHWGTDQPRLESLGHESKNGPHASACGPFCFRVGRSTSVPVVRKAHGTAQPVGTDRFTEPRLAGLLQAVNLSVPTGWTAVLEQPSPRGALGDSLG